MANAARDQWVESGQIAALTNGGQVVRIGYGLETKPLPFSLRLANFEVPRDEGTDSPSNFIATIEFRDSATGAVKTGVAKMNHPASFPGTLRRQILRDLTTNSPRLSGTPRISNKQLSKFFTIPAGS